jgi:hypothetical protein
MISASPTSPATAVRISAHPTSTASTAHRITTIPNRSRAASPEIPAVAYCQGTPLRNEIEARAAARIGEATDRASDAIARRFGKGEVDGKLQAHVVAIEK